MSYSTFVSFCLQSSKFWRWSCCDGNTVVLSLSRCLLTECVTECVTGNQSGVLIEYLAATTAFHHLYRQSKKVLDFDLFESWNFDWELGLSVKLEEQGIVECETCVRSPLCNALHHNSQPIKTKPMTICRFDTWRTLRLAAYGGTVAGPLGHFWFSFLDARIFPQAPKRYETQIDELARSPSCYATAH